MNLKDIYRNYKPQNYLFDEKLTSEFVKLRVIHKEIKEINNNFIINLLDSNDEKWFVASYLKTVEKFDLIIFRKLIETAINTSDPSFNKFFIEPCIRVYGCVNVIDEINKLSNSENSLSILSVLYHTHSQILHIGTFENNNYTDITWKNIGFKYCWNKQNNCYLLFSKKKEKRMSNLEYDKYLPIDNEFKKKKKEMIMNIKNKTNDNAIKEYANSLLD